jgi:CRISPR type I-D-associated protein Csc2
MCKSDWQTTNTIQEEMTMAKKTTQTEKTAAAQVTSSQAEKPAAPKMLPRTMLTGVNADPGQLVTVMVTALLETTGQVRFGDGTDIDTTITEKDQVALPDGDSVTKYVWAGTKRRGVDRRVIHELRDRYWQDTKCYIGDLCGRCPTCWLYGFTGTTKPKGDPVKEINAKSRILYATSLSVESMGDFPTNRHARNAVDEKTQKTGTAESGESGIHREEFIPEGIHFPLYTAALRVLGWEFGAFAHGLLESLNSNRYTAGSRAMGGMKFVDVPVWQGPALIVDVSPDGVFPLAAPKISSAELRFDQALKTLTGGIATNDIKSTLAAMGFKEPQDTSSSQNASVIANTSKSDIASDAPITFTVEDNQHTTFTFIINPGSLIVSRNGAVLMTRYWGERARGYLESQRQVWHDYLNSLEAGAFWQDANAYINAIQHKEAEPTAGESGGDDGSNAEIAE